MIPGAAGRLLDMLGVPVGDRDAAALVYGHGGGASRPLGPAEDQAPLFEKL